MSDVDKIVSRLIDLLVQAIDETTDPEKLNKFESMLEYVGILIGKDMKK